MIPKGLKAMMAEAQAQRQEAEEAERKRKEQEERDRIEAEQRAIAEAQAAERRRKEQAEAERKAKEEAERKQAEEIEHKMADTAISMIVRTFNEVLKEEGTNHDAVRVFKKRLRSEAMDAYAHRYDSPEATEYNRVLWEEYDKVVKAVQSGRVETMEDLKREIQDSGMNEEQRHKQAKENYERIRQKLVKIFNDVLTERGNNHSAVLGYNKRVFDLVYDAQAHRNESYEASEYFNVLSNEYQKITRAIYQSGHVETMADLKRELGF